MKCALSKHFVFFVLHQISIRQKAVNSTGDPPQCIYSVNRNMPKQTFYRPPNMAHIEKSTFFNDLRLTSYYYQTKGLVILVPKCVNPNSIRHRVDFIQIPQVFWTWSSVFEVLMIPLKLVWLAKDTPSFTVFFDLFPIRNNKFFEIPY